MEEVQKFVQSDSKWLAFIIDQITANALKYVNEGGEIFSDLRRIMKKTIAYSRYRHWDKARRYTSCVRKRIHRF